MLVGDFVGRFVGGSRALPATRQQDPDVTRTSRPGYGRHQGSRRGYTQEEWNAYYAQWTDAEWEAWRQRRQGHQYRERGEDEKTCFKEGCASRVVVWSTNRLDGERKEQIPTAEQSKHEQANAPTSRGRIALLKRPSVEPML
eukprot:s3521_g10.t1